MPLSAYPVAVRARILVRALARVRTLGGPGSGHFGHEGRPGEVGGSAPSSMGADAGGAPVVPSGILAAIHEADGGFTYHPLTGTQPTKGFVVSLHKDRERVITAQEATVDALAQYAKDNWDLLTQSNNYMGGWHNPQDDKVYLDVSTVLDSEDEALRQGAAAQQLAIFDLEHGRSIEVRKRAATVRTFRGGRRYGRQADLEFDGTERRTTDTGRSHRAIAPSLGARTDGGGDRQGEGDFGARLTRTLYGVAGHSGFYDHLGRPGERGGSLPRGIGADATRSHEEQHGWFVPTYADRHVRRDDDSLRTPTRASGKSKRLGGGINETLIIETAGGQRYVLKPIAGERFHAREGRIDNTDSTLAEREVLASRVDNALELGLVPPTVMAEFEDEQGRTVQGSIQEFVPDARVWDAAEKGKVDRAQLAKLGVLDALIGNLDRHGGNGLVKDGRLFGIDHGYSFGKTRPGDHVRSFALRQLREGDLSESEQRQLGEKIRALPLESVFKGAHLDREERDAFNARLALVKRRLLAGQAEQLKYDFDAM